MRSKSNYITPEQIEQIIKHIPDLKIRKWKNEDIIMLIMIAYWCGLRMGEAVRLKKEDFDFERKEIYLGKTKTEKEDYAAIPDSFLPELESFVQFKEAGDLFPGCNVQIVTIWLKRLGRMLNIAAFTTPQSVTGEKTVTHGFRKSIGKDMLWGTHDGRKAPLNVISKHLRHKGKNPLATTAQYLKLNIEDVKDWFGESTTESEQIKL